MKYWPQCVGQFSHKAGFSHKVRFNHKAGFSHKVGSIKTQFET